MYKHSSVFCVSSCRSRALACLVLVIFSCSFFPSISLAQQPTATVSALSGTVLVNGQAGNPGTALSAGDIVETQAGARVVLEISDGSLLELGENTKLDMAELSQTATGARVSRVKLVWGWIRAKLSPGHQQAGSSFDIETPNALVGVKFSQPDVEVSYDPDKQETVGLARTVALSARNLMTNEELIVPVGSTVIITTTTIKIVAGLLSLGKASDEIIGTDTSQTKMPEPGATGTEATGAEATEAEMAATGAETAATGTTEAGTGTSIGGLSAKTLALVGLGVVAVGGGIAAIASGGSDDDGNNGGSSSGANDSFTGTFEFSPFDNQIRRFVLNQSGTTLTGNYIYQASVDISLERDGSGWGTTTCTYPADGTVNGTSATIMIYAGECRYEYPTPWGSWTDPDNDPPGILTNPCNVSLVENGNILRAEPGDFIRQ